MTSNNADEIVVNWSSGVVDLNVNSSADDFLDRIMGKSRGELRAKEHTGDLPGKYPPNVGSFKPSSGFPPQQPERESSWLQLGIDGSEIDYAGKQ